MAQKLIKVAKEFNVGLHTIVETLHSKGFAGVEEKPTADISDEMLVVLRQEFQKDLAIKQEADKLARPVLKKEPVAVSGGTTTTTGGTPVAPRPSLLPPREEIAKPKPEQQPLAKKEEPDVVVRERPALRVIGKIDLDATKKAPVPAEPPQPTPLPAAEEAVPETQQPEPPQPSREEKPVATPAEPAATPPAAGETGAEEDFYRADSPTLRGLKILGRISLDKPKPEQTGEGDQRGGRRDDRRGGQGGRDNRGGRRDDNRGGQGRDNRGQQPRPQGQGGGQQQNRPAAPAGQGGGSGQQQAGGDRHKRKRKKVQQPINAASLQATMTGNQGDNKGRGRRDEPKEVSQKQIEDQIRQTMARIGAGASRKRQKVRRDKRDVRRERAELEEMARTEGEKTLQVTEFISVSDLASLMNVKPADVIKTCMGLGIFVSINQRLDAELIEVVASEFGYAVQFISAEEQVEVEEEEVDDPKDLVSRQPIVTVMGHVDHGKTSLLDFIRSAKVAEGEAGGITQHIGAYEVTTDDGRKITFLDTPGHEAFTAMRARGAKVTDIAIIVIAADDSIMPQTREAISHAQAAGVPIVFAINKIDKAGADPERIKNELAQMNLLVEEWGGKYQSQDISAKKGINVDKLLEKVLLEAELLELHANPKRRAVGTVLEASLEKGLGYVSKVLIENGTIDIGDPIIAGEHAGRVKALFNERGKKVKSAGPAQPVMVLGLPGAPQAGEKIKEAATDAEAKEIAARRAQIIREQATRASKRISLEEIGRRLALGNFKELNLIVKGDVDGSIEALSDSLIKLSMEKIQVNVIHKAVGQIVDSDVMLASASDAIIIGFQVRPSLTARKLAEKEGVEIKLYSIIYEAIEEIKAAMEGMLEPTKEEEIMGQTEIREVYKISKVGTVAGCYVLEGKISRNHYVRIIRDGIVVYPVNPGQHAELASLKRFKEDAKEVKAGLECGMTIRNFNDIKAGDIVESYIVNEVKATL
ncbi:MAG: translation initiation factor IF-2 [Haliscomenobacteraceae bacterium CHB4]|nr:Elongation factor 4 [Saprospiraceae bacterium]MCE7926694.1 translation initiation factor IF-2 [Haliscomenobacteraceae bacterium CHB4]